MKFVNPVDSDFQSDENDSYSEQEPEIETKSTAKSNKRKRKYEDIPTDAATSKKKHKNDLYKPPTVEELNNLRETENLFNNNLFRLQIEELLTAIKIKSKRKNKLTNWLDVFTHSIKSLPSVRILLSELATLRKAKIKGKTLLSNFVLLGKIFETDQDVTLNFEGPKNIQYFGLFQNNSLPGPNLTFNINLTMPNCCFLVKDYLNNRYLLKRCYYLLYVAEFLKQNDLVDDLKIDFHETNHLHPIINLQPKDCDKTNILIHVSPPEDYFKPTRFLPEQNNVKLDLFQSQIDLDILKNTPTVLYNSLLAHDVTLYTNNEFITEILKDLTNIQNGIKLLCVWLNQRELSTGLGAFTETLGLYLVVYLLNKKKINEFMSSYQIVRNVWNFLTTTDLLTEAISIGEASLETLAKFKQHFSIVFLDKTCCYNVASFLNAEMYKKVKLESQIALKYLDDNKSNAFHELFLTKYPFHLQYDVIINLTKSIPFGNKLKFTEKQKSLYVGYENILTYDYIYQILKKALNKRVLNIVPKIDTCGKELKRFLFGINLNPDEAFNFIEKGPPLNDFTEAAAFRDFWGELATDRRFRDGSTNVAVYFKTNTIKGKRNIIMKIINFVMEEKLELKFKVHYNEFEDVLLFKKLVPNYPSGTNEETCLKIILASDELSKKLRELQTSLKIIGVQGMSDVFAYAEVFPPIPANFKADNDVTTVLGNNLTFNLERKVGKIPRYIQPIECVLQLEYSSKWPNDLQALRHIKALFYLKIASLLKTNHNFLTHPTREYLDVFCEGIVFRYRLFVPKEIGLLKQIDTEEGLTSFKETAESFDTDISLNILPKIIGELRGVQSLHPSYGPGTALVKRWLRAHLVDECHISDTVIDLLNASLYLNNSSGMPSTPQISFLRFLKFISELDWSLQLVIVNFNDYLTSDEISEVESKVQNNRNSFPNLFILTPYDQSSSVFSKNSPSKEILKRIRRLAVESLAFHERIIVDQNRVGIKELFIPNFDGYNVLIRLKSSLNPKRHQQITFSSVGNRVVVDKYKISTEDKMPIVDFDPVREYLTTLRDAYGKYAIFFHDSYGGNVIGVLWRPGVSEISDFKGTKMIATKIIKDKIVFNVDAAIDDFFMLGTKLVQNIEKR